MQELVERQFNERIAVYTELSRVIESNFLSALSEVDHIDRISARVKSQSSFARKVAVSGGKYSCPISEIEDQIAVRVIVFFRTDIEVVRGVILENFNKYEITSKRPTNPREFDYESEHLILAIPPHFKPEGWQTFTPMPNAFELQVRTLFMHAWSEPQHDIAYKGETDELEKRLLAWIAASAWGADEAYQRIIENRKRFHSP